MTVQDVDNAFRKKAESNIKLYVIRKKIENGTATMEDMSEYSNILCKLLGKTLGENISGIPESERAKFCEWLLRNQYEDTNERLATVQRFLDKKQNIHIAAKKPKFPAERVRKAAHSLEDKTVSEEVIQRRAENAVANIANSFHDDYIKENAEFRQNAGLKCHVTRTGASKCCAWCAEVAGRYEVGREPADFWRRHDNCSCRMDYENQKVRQRLSGQGKGWKVDSEVQRRQAQRIEYKPTRLNQEQAKALENEKLSRIKGLTIAGKTDTIQESGTIDKRNNRTSENTVNLEYLKSDEYKSKFKQITNNTKVNQQIYKQAKAQLTHRNGTDLEDMCLIDSVTGQVVGRQSESQSAYGVDYNNSLNNAITNHAPYTLISLHNHPTNNPPTGSDLVSNAVHKYALGIVATHDGRVFSYKAGEKPFTSSFFNSRVDKYRGMMYNLSESEAIIKALDDFAEEYGVEWSEYK